MNFFNAQNNSKIDLIFYLHSYFKKDKDQWQTGCFFLKKKFSYSKILWKIVKKLSSVEKHVWLAIFNPQFAT